MNKKGLIPVVLAFQIAFSAIGIVVVSHIPARQNLKTKLIDRCVLETSSLRQDCKSLVDGMTQKERVEIDTQNTPFEK